MFERIMRWMQSDFLADSEAESDRNGYLSWRAEWHAAGWGFAAFFVAFATVQPMLLSGGVSWLLTAKNARDAPAYIPYPHQFLKESAYLLGHGVAGAIAGTFIRTQLLGQPWIPPF